MAESDKVFAGSLPKFYDTLMVPLIFEAYAAGLAELVAASSPGSVLETAAGSGVVTRALAPKLGADGFAGRWVPRASKGEPWGYSRRLGAMRLSLASAARIVPLLLLLAACAPVPQEPDTPVSSAVASTATPPAASTPPIAPAPTNAYHAPAGALPKLSVATRGAFLDVTFENAGTAPVYLYTHMNADTDQYDWITVELTDAAAHVRELHFAGTRDKSAPQNVELAPGQHVTETIDLAAWAGRPANGRKPLRAGTYTVAVFYDSSTETYAWAGKLSASTVLVVK